MDDSSSLPTGWTWATVDQLAVAIQYGYTSSARERRDGPRFLRITDIQEGKVDWEAVPSCDIPQGKFEKYRLALGDLLFARTGATTGKSYLIKDCPEAAFASYLIRLRLTSSVMPEYVFAFFQSSAYWKQIEEGKRGIGQPNVNARILGRILIPLPPVSEQRRIVEEIEKQFTRLDSGVAALTAVQSRLKTYRASLLKAACGGDLVPGEAEIARAQTRDYEPGNVLLERVLRERRTSEGKNDKYHERLANLPGLPEGWCWATVEQVAMNFDSRRIPLKEQERDRRPGPYPYYGASGIIDYVDDYLFDGDFLLVAEDGANLLSRRTPIAFPASGRFWVNNHAHVVQTIGEIPLTYLEISLNGYDLEFNVTGSAQPKLTQASLNSIAVPLPPLAEQRRIVAEVERRLSVVKALERSVVDNLKRAERLRNSILELAFQGKLAPQNPQDEPANLLLERVQIERGDRQHGNARLRS